MGDSGWRAHYTSELRAEEIRAVIAAAQLGERPFVIGHSFGGFMTMKVASQYGDMLGGAVIVDSPIRSPEEEARHPLTRPPMGNRRVYETFDAALARFRLMPEQPCDNPFIVEFIGRHRIRHYGLLASAGCKTNIARARELMAAPIPEVDPPAAHDTADPHTTTDYRPPCPCCGGRMIIVEVFARSGAPRGPPPSGAGIRI